MEQVNEYYHFPRGAAMRIRTIKPEFWTDEKVAGWDSDTRLAFVWTWSAADDYGRLRLTPALLRSGAFAYHEMPMERAREILATFTRSGRVILYEVQGEVYGQIVSWDKHQKVDKPGKFQNPSPDQGVMIDSRHSRDTLATLSPCTGSGLEVESEGERKISYPTGTLAPSPRKTRTPKPKPADKPYLDMDDSWEWKNITDDYRKAWAQDFPGIDLDDELRKARAWVRADPAKRRKKDWVRFLGSTWFAKAQQSASGSAGKPNHADYRALDRAAEREWQRVIQSSASNDYQKIGFAVAMLHPRTIEALKVIDKDPANAVWRMADIPLREQLTYKTAFIPAWKASGIPYEVDE